MSLDLQHASERAEPAMVSPSPGARLRWRGEAARAVVVLVLGVAVVWSTPAATLARLWPAPIGWSLAALALVVAGTTLMLAPSRRYSVGFGRVLVVALCAFLLWALTMQITGAWRRYALDGYRPAPRPVAGTFESLLSHSAAPGARDLAPQYLALRAVAQGRDIIHWPWEPEAYYHQGELDPWYLTHVARLGEQRERPYDPRLTREEVSAMLTPHADRLIEIWRGKAGKRVIIVPPVVGMPADEPMVVFQYRQGGEQPVLVNLIVPLSQAPAREGLAP